MSIYVTLNLFFLCAALLLYVVFGGADFGAGIVEAFSSQKNRLAKREVIAHAMAPVWEANHVWLILVVVILFMGFPKIYAFASEYLHMPIIAVLMGIVARGCAFTFRYYDTLDAKLHSIYNFLFLGSSFWTAFFLGVCAGAYVLGNVDPNAASFSARYVDSWLNWFCAAMGFFVCALFAFLASVYLVGETSSAALKRQFRISAAWANVAVIIGGIAVYVTASSYAHPLLASFFSNPLSLISFVTASLLWWPFWYFLWNDRFVYLPRFFGAAIVGLVMIGWYAAQFPIALRYSDGDMKMTLTVDAVAAAEPVQRALLGALCVGLCLILPALVYLFRIFKRPL